LESLADWCGPVLRRAGLYDRAAGTAAVLQTSLLPPALPLLEGLDIHARYVPSHRSDVGGDFYDVFALPEGRVGMVVGDAVGHGIAAATQMGQARHALRTLAFVEGDPLRVLELFDAKVAQFGENLMVTATVVFLDRQTGRIRYAQAGHPPGMIRRRNGRVTVLGSPQRPPLGVRATPRPGTASAEAEVHPGDTLVLYTDGLIERVGEPLDTGLARLEAALVSIPTDLNAAAERLLQELVAFGGDDDLALLLARRG
jgi:serine phosphatase RsbU (regulator of sigma subunit)